MATATEQADNKRLDRLSAHHGIALKLRAVLAEANALGVYVLASIVCEDPDQVEVIADLERVPLRYSPSVRNNRVYRRTVCYLDADQHLTLHADRVVDEVKP